MKKREIHWSSAGTTSSGVVYTPPVEQKQLVMASGSLPLPTKADRKKSAKKSIVFVPSTQGGSTAPARGLREIKREHSVEQFVLSAKPGSVWKLAYSRKRRAICQVYSIFNYPDAKLEFVRSDDRDFAKNSIFVFVKHDGKRSIFLSMSGRLFSFTQQDKDAKSLIEKVF